MPNKTSSFSRHNLSLGEIHFVLRKIQSASFQMTYQTMISNHYLHDDREMPANLYLKHIALSGNGSLSSAERPPTVTQGRNARRLGRGKNLRARGTPFFQLTGVLQRREVPDRVKSGIVITAFDVLNSILIRF